MKSVVTSVVTPKSGLTIRNPCENLYNGWKRVEFPPLYITKWGKCVSSRILTPVFQVTTEVTTVSNPNHKLGRHFCEKTHHICRQKPGTSPRGVNVRQSVYLRGEIPSVEGIILNSRLNKEIPMSKNEILYNAYSFVDGLRHNCMTYNRVPIEWHAQNRKKPIVDYQEKLFSFNYQSDSVKRTACLWIDQAFSEEEIAVIKPIIQKISYGFTVCHIITLNMFDGFPLSPYQDLNPAEHEGFINLVGHGLSRFFRIWV